MTKQKMSLANLLQVLANVGILVGLVLVAFQMKQTNDITASQLGAASQDSLINHSLTVTGENPDEAMFRVLLRPEEASDQDLFIAEQVYASILQQLYRLVFMDEAGLEIGRFRGSVYVRSYWFASPHGLAYLDQTLEAFSEGSDPRLRQTLELLRDAAANRPYSEVFADRKARMGEPRSTPN